jgi:hypothetical protein
VARDFILRLIEQMATMLAALMNRRRAGEIIEAREDLENTCARTVGLTLSNVKELAPEALTRLLERSGALKITRAVMLAELLLLDADWKEQDSPEKDVLPNYVHAFCLLADSLDSLSAEEEAFFRPKLDRAAGKLGALANHPYINERLRKFGLAEA